ncbi:hypothetical protein CHUAL_010681 [Chamberlinius hualienensis]
MLISVVSILVLSLTLASAVPMEVEDSALIPNSREKRALPAIIAAAGAAIRLAINQAAKGRNIIIVNNYVGSNLDVQCKSGDDDLGRKTLRDKEGFAFGFKANIWGTTHFWCDVWWNGKHKYFPAYGEGAPKGSMTYDIYGSGFYRNGGKFQNW